MSQLFQIHPENPQKRLIQQAVDIIKKGTASRAPAQIKQGCGDGPNVGKPIHDNFRVYAGICI